MTSACGVTWDGTSGGELDESAIPSEEFESHYLNDADTKSESSFPVVDSDGNLRAGNVNSAWDLRNNGEGVSEECLRKLDNAFDDNVLPESAYENSMTETFEQRNGTDETDYGMNVTFASAAMEALSDGFNKHGVRENDDGSVDARFRIMEPGVRNGVKITESFLRRVVSKDYGRLPVQLDHSKSQRANVGYIEAGDIQFSNGAVMAQVHIPNTGSSVRSDIISDFTHEPPQVQDGSIGLDPDSVEVESPDKRGGTPEFVDGRLREVSLTPFPGGYDNGGLTPEFSEALDDMASCGCGGNKSQLNKRPHTLRKK